MTGPEVADALSLGHFVSIDIKDIHVILNLTYCSVKTAIKRNKQHWGNQRGFYVHNCIECVSLEENIA